MHYLRWEDYRQKFSLLLGRLQTRRQEEKGSTLESEKNQGGVGRKDVQDLR
jgi:hypothetical protein